MWWCRWTSVILISYNRGLSLPWCVYSVHEVYLCDVMALIRASLILQVVSEKKENKKREREKGKQEWSVTLNKLDARKRKSYSGTCLCVCLNMNECSHSFMINNQAFKINYGSDHCWTVDCLTNSYEWQIKVELGNMLSFVFFFTIVLFKPWHLSNINKCNVWHQCLIASKITEKTERHGINIHFMRQLKKIDDIYRKKNLETPYKRTLFLTSPLFFFSFLALTSNVFSKRTSGYHSVFK